MPDQSVVQLETQNNLITPFIGGELMCVAQPAGGGLHNDCAVQVGDVVRATYLPFFYEIAVSPEDSLTEGNALVTFRLPAFTLTAIRASLSTADSTNALIMDVLMNGTSIFTTNKLQIDNTSRTSVGSSLPPNNHDHKFSRQRRNCGEPRYRVNQRRGFEITTYRQVSDPVALRKRLR
jgi:hypothetical protein